MTGVEIRELRAFVAVVEEGGLSAAARRLHVSQPALSQTMAGLERRLGVRLLVRSPTGVQPTDAGATLLTEGRTVLAAHDRALTAMARHTGTGGGVLRLGVPLELPADLLSAPLAELATSHPGTKVDARHLSTAAQFAALRAGDLDAGLVREHPLGDDLDAMLVVEERLGVLLASATAAKLGEVSLAALTGLDWVGFPRSSSPAWHDEVVAILRSHGIDPGTPAAEGQELIAEVKHAAVAAGTAFALAPPGWPAPSGSYVTWRPLAGHPLVRCTWAVWPAVSRRPDVAALITSFDRA